MACFLNFLFLFSTCLINIQGVVSLKESHILPSESFTHLLFYLHDILDGEHPTTVKIINAPSDSHGSFGTTYMVDSPLTEERDRSSKLIGRAQGTYAMASQQFDFVLKMDINFIFTEGTYNGSTLTMLGRNVIMDKVREMPIVGGTGVFRFARGYALANTAWYNSTSGNAIEEFNVTISHF